MAKPKVAPKRNDVVEIAGRFYSHEVFVCAVNTVGMERIQRAIPENATDRQMGRNLAALKTPHVAAEVRAEALRRVVAAGGGTEALGPNDVVVARFRPLTNQPTPGIDKRTDPGNIGTPEPRA